MISQPQRLNTQELLKELGDVFFADLFDAQRSNIKQYYDSTFKDHRLVRAGYYTQPNVTGSKPIFA